MQRAMLLFDRGHFIEAEREIRASLQEGDDSAYAHALLGLCLAKARLLDDARAELAAALARDPNDAFNHYALSFVEEVALSRDDFLGRRRLVLDVKASRGSLQGARRAVELAPEEERYWVRLAEVLQMQQRWQESIEPAEAALRLSPHNCPTAIALAEALIRLRRSQEARAVLHRALEQNPAASAAHAGMGWALLRAGDHQRAEEFFNEALRIHANSEWAQHGALECAKRRFRIHRWLSDIKRWFENQNRFFAVVAGLALAAAIFGAFSAYFYWADPFIRKHLGHRGFALFTLCWLVAGCLVVFFHNEIYLWFARRHVAAKTTVGFQQRQFTKRLLLLMAIGGAFVPLNLLLANYSELAPAILAGLTPGLFSIAVVFHTFRAGKRRWLWFTYVLLMLAVSPIIIVAWYRFMEEVPKLMHLAAVMFVPFIPLFFACDAENKKAQKRRHQNAVNGASQVNSE